MAFPSDSARQGTNITTASTSHNINVGSPVSGTLLIVFVRFAAAPGTVTFTGYTSLVSDTSDASDDTTQVFYRLANGEEGATDTLTTGNSVKLGAIAYEITGAEHPPIQPPQVSSAVIGTTTANTCNSGSVSPTGGAKDYLWLTLGGGDQEVGAFTAAPTNYANLATANSGTGGTAATNVIMGGASRQLNAASEDPGAFTHAAMITGWTGFTVAIHPASVPFTPNAKVPWHGVIMAPSTPIAGGT